MESMHRIFSDNVLRMLKEKHISQKNLAEMINCTYENLNAVLKGRSQLSRSMMNKIAEALDIDLEQLLVSNSMANVGETYMPYGDGPHLNLIPFLETKEKEGRLEVRTSQVKAPIGFKSEWLYQMGTPENMVFVRTMGDSLDGEIPDNSLVLVDLSQNVVVSNSPYFLRVEKELLIKRVDNSSDTAVVYSDRNGQTGRLELTQDTDWEIIGRCLWYSRTLS